MIGELYLGVMSSLIAAGIVFVGSAVRKFAGVKRLVAWALTHPRTQIRVSVAALVAVHANGQYLLVRQVRRTYQLGPIGGAVSAFEDGIEHLRKIGFVPESGECDAWQTRRTPLRGRVVGLRALSFWAWLAGDSGRESYRECAERELVEELEDECPTGLTIPRFARFRYVRQVVEGPKRLAGKGTWQWRVFQVFIWDMKVGNGNGITKRELEDVVGQSDCLQFVTSDEIRRGLSVGSQIIGSHAEYLLDEKERRPEI